MGDGPQSASAAGHDRTLRVHSFPLCAVKGALFSRSRPVPVALDAGGFAFDNPLLPWVRAGQLIMHLGGFTVTAL